MKKLLIANRGEIACRVIKTAKKLGIKTVAVYSEIDRYSLHVQMADEAYCIGDSLAKNSYLNQEKIIALAKKVSANAIHPGYGFLAEDADFAELCEKNGVIFVGPSARAIAAMGDKSQAKIMMQKANVPITPGYQGLAQDEKTLLSEAKKIGFPLLIKAVSGGGGKGMRRVDRLDDFLEALTSAKREAQSSFADDRVLLEKYIEKARHIEIQILLDNQGHGIYLLDRDCSLQRRHQKIIEEAPSRLSEKTKKIMGETAVKAAKSIQYTGAGTFEFLVDEHENFYFMEMNTRLQVEHPVTEMITGLDLVEWQLKIADNEPLTLKQASITPHGHAIEARICAENPDQDFLPAIGRLNTLIFPTSEAHIRIDTGVIEGDSISPYYDSMIAKMIAWGETRAQALTSLKNALSNTMIIGVNTNISFLHRLLSHVDFEQQHTSTQWVEQHQKELKSPEKLSDAVITLIGYSIISPKTRSDADPYSPWDTPDHWRSFQETPIKIHFWWKNQPYEWISENAKKINKKELEQALKQSIIHDEKNITVFYEGEQYTISLINPEQKNKEIHKTEHLLISPMPGTVVDVLVKPQQPVKAGDRLMIIEAMKMEHVLHAPRDGIIKTILFKAGDSVSEGAELLDME